MDCAKRLVAATAAIAGFSMPVHAAAQTTSPAPIRAARTNSAQAPLSAPKPLARNGGVRRVSPAASAASAASDPRDDVQTTVEEGRITTRNAHPRAEGSAGSAPNN